MDPKPYFKTINQKGKVQPAGRLNSTQVHTGLRSAETLNSKQRRSREFWKNAAQKVEKALPVVVDPKTLPEAADFFRFAKQTNMGLREDMEDNKIMHGVEYIDNVNRWNMSNLPPASLPREIPLDLGAPIGQYRDIPVYFVDKTNFKPMLCLIETCNEFSIDLECHDSHSFLGMTALIQLATRTVVFLIDPFSCFEEIKQHLRPLLQSPGILKLMFGMGNDIKMLQKDFATFALGVIDLQLMYNQIRTDGKKDLISLTNLCKLKITDFQDVKQCTLMDWRRRPLTEEMIVYAASDVVLLFELWDLLRPQMTAIQLGQGIADGKKLLLAAYKKKKIPTADEDLKLIQPPVESLTQETYDRYCMLHQWRERYAGITDETPLSLISTNTLLSISKAAVSVSRDTLKMLGVPSKLLQEQSETLLKILNDDGKDLLRRINNCECHNCCLKGHAAVHCPFPSNKKRTKMYGEMHPEYKTSQNRRRRKNLKRNNKIKKQRQRQ